MDIDINNNLGGFTMKIVFLLITLLALAGCNSQTIRGFLNTEKDFSLIDEAGQSVSISPGLYQAKVEIKPDKNEIELDLKKKDWDGEFVFHFPTTHLPENGDFFLKHSDTGQLHDIKGTNKTEAKIVDRVYERHSCYKYYYHYKYGWLVYRGYRSVEYDVIKNTLTVEFKVIPPGSAPALAAFPTEIFATFSGIGHRTRYIERYRGPCRAFGGKRLSAAY